MILDVGCGSGRWLNTLARFGWETWGIEPATKVAFARHRELKSIPEDGSFDLIVLQSVLEHLRNPGEALRVAHHLLLSHGLAAQAIRAAAQRPVNVGIVLNLSPVHPASDSAKDRAAADRLDLVMNRVFLDGILKGTSPIEALPLVGKLARKRIRPGDLESLRTCDLLGVNYYTRNVMRHDPRVPIIAAEQIRPEGNEYSAMWEIYPEGLYELLTRIWKEYKPECDLMVTENGGPPGPGSARTCRGRVSPRRGPAGSRR